MERPFTSKLAEGNFVFKYAKFRMSLLRVGLPFVLIREALMYGSFLVEVHDSRLHYPWKFELVVSVPLALFVSAAWWFLMREIAAWKLRDRERQR